VTGTPRKARIGERGRRDLRTAGAAILLLALCGGIWLWMSAAASERREKVLAGVPTFPARGQEPRPRPLRAASAPLEPAHVRPAPPAPPRLANGDSITSFVLKPAPFVALVHVNALLNTPLFARIKECAPTGWRQVSDGMAEMGIDLEHDVDRLAMVGDGMALSGFFTDKPIAQNIASHWPGVEERGYRGQKLWLSQDFGIAQMANLIVLGPSASMEPLLDRVLDPPPAGADPQDVFGDLFVHADLKALRDSSTAGGSDPMGAILEGLSDVTVRANVWEMVALSLEGKPQSGRDPRDLARIARGAISLAKEQLDPSDVELAALASLARVDNSKDGLQIDLALPANDLFDKLHFPCPGAHPGELRALDGAPDAGQ